MEMSAATRVADQGGATGERTALRRWSSAAVLVWALTVAAGDVARGAAADNPREIGGTWKIVDPPIRLRPMDGSPIPFTQAGQAAYQRNIDGLKNGTVQDFALTLCLPPGIARVMANPNALELVLAPGVVAVLTEGFYRVVRLDAEHNTEDIELFPAFMGDQVARWEGDTLVIDTLGVNPYTWLDASGLPHGYDLHTVERIRRIDGGTHLENVITIEDPEFFTKTWAVRYVYETHPYVSMATGGHPCDDRGGASRYIYERPAR